jgi:cytochrome P450
VAGALDVDLSDVASWVDGPPHAVFDVLRGQDSIAWQPTAGAPTGGFWSLTRFDDIVEVSRDRDRFTVTRGAAYPATDLETFGENMMLKDPPEHTRLRRIVSKGFSPRVVARFEHWVQDIVDETLDHIEGLDTFDFVDEVASVVPGLVIADILGVPRDKRRDIVSWANTMFAAYSNSVADPEGIARAGASLISYAFELQELKRSQPAEDIVSELVASPEQLTDDEFKSFFVLLLMAGYETTHTMMAQGMREIVENDAVARHVSTQVAGGNVGAVVEEILRFESPVNQMTRCANRDIEFRGQKIAEGDMVVMWYTAANRDPSIFSDPNVFDATRSDNPHQGFGGGGAHFCMGAHLARLEGRILFESLHERGITLRLAGEPQRIPNLFINQLGKLPVARR